MTAEHPYFTAQMQWGIMRKNPETPLAHLVDHTVGAYFAHPSLPLRSISGREYMMYNPYTGWQPFVRGFFHKAGARPAEIVVTGNQQLIRIVKPQDISPELASEGIAQSWRATLLNGERGSNANFTAQVTQLDYSQTRRGPYLVRRRQEDIPPIQVLDEAMDIFKDVRIWFD